MDERTLTALKESIVKWEKRAAGDHYGNLGCSSCPLCRLFHSEFRTDDEESCTGCPIFEKTEEDYCNLTPYIAYTRNNSDKNAKLMLDFLKSLLPVEEVSEEKPKAGFAWTDLKYLG